MRRWRPAPTMSASCSFRRARVTSRLRRHGRLPSLPLDASKPSRSWSTPTTRPSIRSSLRSARACCSFMATRRRTASRRSGHRRYDPVRRKSSRRFRRSRWPWARLRLACPWWPSCRASLRTVRRARSRQCLGGLGYNRRRHGRRVVWRGAGSRGEGRGPGARVHPGGEGGTPAAECVCLMSAILDQPSLNSYRTGPDERGHFGLYGGRYVAETLMPLILDLERAYTEATADPSFQAAMDGHRATYVGRPSPRYFAERLTQHCGGAKIYFKREELNHTGAHKVNNVLGQIMLAKRMGKTRIIAETGAGMHGVATATLCAKFGLRCIVYMGAVDVERQKPNVLRMNMLGAEVRPVESGARTLKDAMNEALRDWVTNVSDTFY